MKAKKFRDVSYIDIDNRNRLVIVCDSAGGIGNKEEDFIRVPPEVTGYFTATVAMVELLSYGARPLSLINTLSVEMDPTGSRILNGISSALEGLDLSEENFITGSTEENIPVTMTGMGIVAIGLVDLKMWEEPRSFSGDIIVTVGLPKVGEEVKKDRGKSNFNVRRLLKFKDEKYVHEILPVGSKGIKFEMDELARTNRLEYDLLKNKTIDLNKSAGPATCALVTLDPGKLNDLRLRLDIPVNIVGKFK